MKSHAYCSFLCFLFQGKYYMFVEKVSQLYRQTLPVLPWVHYLQDDQEIGRWFAIATVVIYILFKVGLVRMNHTFSNIFKYVLLLLLFLSLHLVHQTEKPLSAMRGKCHRAWEPLGWGLTRYLFLAACSVGRSTADGLLSKCQCQRGSLLSKCQCQRGSLLSKCQCRRGSLLSKCQCQRGTAPMANVKFRAKVVI